MRPGPHLTSPVRIAYGGVAMHYGLFESSLDWQESLKLVSGRQISSLFNGSDDESGSREPSA